VQTGPSYSTVSGGEALELQYSGLDLVVIQPAKQDLLKVSKGFVSLPLVTDKNYKMVVLDLVTEGLL